MAWAIETAALNWNEDSEVLRLANKMDSGGMRSRKAIEQELLSYGVVPGAFTVRKRAKRCSSRRPCNTPVCYRCAVIGKKRSKRQLMRGQKLQPGVVNYVGPKDGRFSRNSRIAAAQRMTLPFDKLPNKNIAAANVMLGIMPGGSNFSKIVKIAKTRVAETLKYLPAGSKAYLRLEWCIKYAGQIRQTFSHDDPNLPRLEDCKDDDLVALLHAHGLIYAPGKDSKQIGELLRTEFTGKNEVHCRSILPEIVSESGEVTYGAQGFAEYSSKAATSTLCQLLPDAPPSDDDDTDYVDTGRAIDQQIPHDELQVEITNNRDKAMAFFADIELHLALKGTNLTIRKGVNRSAASDGLDTFEDEFMFEDTEASAIEMDRRYNELAYIYPGHTLDYELILLHEDHDATEVDMDRVYDELADNRNRASSEIKSESSRSEHEVHEVDDSDSVFDSMLFTGIQLLDTTSVYSYDRNQKTKLVVSFSVSASSTFNQTCSYTRGCTPIYNSTCVTSSETPYFVDPRWVQYLRGVSRLPNSQPP